LPPHARCLPSRQQSLEILRLAAKVCMQVPLFEVDDDISKLRPGPPAA
jgi:hypothetical protein